MMEKRGSRRLRSEGCPSPDSSMPLWRLQERDTQKVVCYAGVAFSAPPQCSTAMKM